MTTPPTVAPGHGGDGGADPGAGATGSEHQVGVKGGFEPISWSLPTHPSHSGISESILAKCTHMGLAKIGLLAPMSLTVVELQKFPMMEVTSIGKKVRSEGRDLLQGSDHKAGKCLLHHAPVSHCTQVAERSTSTWGRFTTTATPSCRPTPKSTATSPSTDVSLDTSTTPVLPTLHFSALSPYLLLPSV